MYPYATKYIYIRIFRYKSPHRSRGVGRHFSLHMWYKFFFPVTSLFKQTTAVFSLSSTLAISDTPKSESDPLSHEQEIFSLHSVTSFWPWVGGRRRGHMTSQGPRNRWWRQTAPLYSCGIFSGSKSKSETAVLQRQLPINRIRST